MKQSKRTAREILADISLVNNKKITVKIGTVEKRNAPETIIIYYIFIKHFGLFEILDEGMIIDNFVLYEGVVIGGVNISNSVLIILGITIVGVIGLNIYLKRKFNTSIFNPRDWNRLWGATKETYTGED